MSSATPVPPINSSIAYDFCVGIISINAAVRTTCHTYLVSSFSALCETLHQPILVRSAMWDESNLVILLWLMSSISTSRKFLNWFRFSAVILLPCKSRVFNLRRDYIRMTWVLSRFGIRCAVQHCRLYTFTWSDSTINSPSKPLVKCNRSSFSFTALSKNISLSKLVILWLSILKSVKFPSIWNYCISSRTLVHSTIFILHNSP